MRDLAVLFVHLIATVARLLGRGGARSVVAESLLLKHQLLILNRSRGESAESSADRPSHCGPLHRLDAPCPPAALGHRAQAFHDHGFPPSARAAQVRLLFSPKCRGRPGPKGPAPELTAAIIEMKRRNPRFGCRRIAQQLSYVFGVAVNKDVVRRVLARHYRPAPGSQGPSWLTFLGHSKDSLWSVDLFRCESLILRSRRCQSQDCQPQQVSVAPSLPRLVSATRGCVTRNSPQTRIES